MKPAPVPRRRPKTPQAAMTIDAILIAVERILERDGPSGLTTNHIAELAGVSIGTLYQYFPNKDALVGALQDKYADDTLGRVRTALAGTEQLPIGVVIARIADAVVSARSSQRPIHRWLIDWRTAAGCQDRYRRALDDFVALITDFLRRRTDTTLADPAIAAFVLVHAVEGIIEAVSLRTDELDLAATAAEAIQLVTAYVT